MVFGDTFVEDETFGRSAPFFYTMKKFLFIILFAFTWQVLYAYDFYADGFYCNILSITEHTCEIESSSTKTGIIFIPQTITYDGVDYTVTRIGWYAFSECTGLISVIIPNSVTRIEMNAFKGCNGMTSITIPENVRNIDSSAFEGCTGLTSIRVLDGNDYYDSRDNCNAIIQKKDNALILGCMNTVIPNSVTSIGNDAFNGCNGLVSVTIPNSVTSIGNDAFNGCSGLVSVTISNNVTSIGKNAFKGCRGITSVTIPNSVTTIGSNAFEGCEKLTDMKFNAVNAVLLGILPTSIKTITIGNEVELLPPLFYNNTNVTSVTIPNSVTRIDNNAFLGCSGLTSVTIPNSVTSIGRFAFSGCSGLTSVTISNSITSINEWTFNGCSGLKSIEIPNNVTSIGNYAFSDCSDLTSIAIPDNVTSIGNNAFSGCCGLAYITIPKNVTSIRSYAFQGCTNLKKIFNNSSLTLSKGSSENGYIAYYANVVYNNVSIEGNFRICKDGKGNSCVCDYFGTDNSITLPKNIYGIADYAFSACCDLISVTIPNNVKSIGNYAFSGCHLQTLTIGTDVTSIGSDAFGYNNSKPYKVIWLPNTPPSGYANVAGNINYVSNENYSKIQNTKVYKHLSSMFEVDGIKYVPVSPSERTCDAIDCNYDKAIENINISDVVSYKNIGMTVLNINPYTFYGNEFIKTLNINNSGKIDERAFYGCKNITSVTLGNKVTGIGDYAFYGCTAIKDIKIPDCVTSVGAYGFSGCGSLKKVVFGDCPTTIGANAFKDCSSLTELNLGKKVEAIGNYTFANCSSLAKISIPKTTTSIENYAFSGCKALTDVTIEDRTESISLGSNGSSPLFADCPINSVYLGGKLSYNTTSSYGYSPFYRNKSLQSVVITDTEEQIYDNEFYGCTNLKSVKIGDGVKSIGNWAFSGCANLESFSFGKSMQSIGKEAFSDCTKMTSITSYAAKAPECGSQALDDIDKWSCVLSVPYSCLASYQNADQWKEFFFIQEAEVDEKLVAAKAAFDKYKSEQKTIIEALAKEDDSDAVKAIINKAISDINAMEYDVKISLDENKAKILSFVNSIDEAVQKQRAEDHKATGIEELEIAEKYNIYDLNGRKITNSMLKSGLYIRNGKKMVVK